MTKQIELPRKFANPEKIDEVEYAQLSLDWRHRDSMSWATITISITATASAINFGKSAIWILAGIFHFLLLIKFVKDDFYKLGSTQLMDNMRNRCEHEHCEVIDTRKDTPRKFKPLEHYIDKRFENRPKSFKRIYKLLSKFPTFDAFFIIQILSIFGAIYGADYTSQNPFFPSLHNLVVGGIVPYWTQLMR